MDSNTKHQSGSKQKAERSQKKNPGMRHSMSFHDSQKNVKVFHSPIKTNAEKRSNQKQDYNQQAIELNINIGSKIQISSPEDRK